MVQFYSIYCNNISITIFLVFHFNNMQSLSPSVIHTYAWYYAPISAHISCWRKNSWGKFFFHLQHLDYHTGPHNNFSYVFISKSASFIHCITIYSLAGYDIFFTLSWCVIQCQQLVVNKILSFLYVEMLKTHMNPAFELSSQQLVLNERRFGKW